MICQCNFRALECLCDTGTDDQKCHNSWPEIALQAESLEQVVLFFSQKNPINFISHSAIFETLKYMQE